MIKPKTTYQHRKSPVKMKVLNPSPMHSNHWHVGLMLDETLVIHCHIHYKDIDEDWRLIEDAKTAKA